VMPTGIDDDDVPGPHRSLLAARSRCSGMIFSHLPIGTSSTTPVPKKALSGISFQQRRTLHHVPGGVDVWHRVHHRGDLLGAIRDSWPCRAGSPDLHVLEVRPAGPPQSPGVGRSTNSRDASASPQGQV
jgi:hypothetical protein